MKNLKLQEESGQCGVYTLGNLLQDINIIKKYGHLKEYMPSGAVQFNKILKKEGYKFIFYPIINSVNWERSIPNKFLAEIINDFKPKKGYVQLFMLGVQVGCNEKGMHYVGLICLDNRYFLTDPMFPTFVEIDNIKQLSMIYQYVNSISSFTNNTVNYLSFKDETFVELLKLNND